MIACRLGFQCQNLTVLGSLALLNYMYLVHLPMSNHSSEVPMFFFLSVLKRKMVLCPPHLHLDLWKNYFPATSDEVFGLFP